MAEWHELVVEGTERTLRAFVAGFLAGRGEHAGGVFGSDVALAAGSLGERLRALFAAGSHRVFLAPAPLAVPLAQALGSAAGSWDSPSSAAGWSNRRDSRSGPRHFRARWRRRSAVRCSPRCPPVCAWSSGPKRRNRIPKRTAPSHSRRCTSTFTAYREISSAHSREFWKSGSARGPWNSWKRVRSTWRGKSSPRNRRASCPARSVGVGATNRKREARDATTEKLRYRGPRARAQGNQPADRESPGQHRRGRHHEAPPAPARATGSGPPARLEDEAPSRPAAQDGLVDRPETLSRVGYTTRAGRGSRAARAGASGRSP